MEVGICTSFCSKLWQNLFKIDNFDFMEQAILVSTNCYHIFVFAMYIKRGKLECILATFIETLWQMGNIYLPWGLALSASNNIYPVYTLQWHRECPGTSYCHQRSWENAEKRKLLAKSSKQSKSLLLPPLPATHTTLHYWPINITLVCSCRYCYWLHNHTRQHTDTIQL